MRRLPAFAALLAFFASAAAAAPAWAQAPAAGQAMPKRKLLVFTYSAGFRHDCIPTMTESLLQMGEKTGHFAATVTRDPDAFEPGNLARYDAVFFYTTRNVLPKPEQRQALFDFVKAGRGFVGSHCATDTLYDNAPENCPEYGEMTGGYFDGHPWHEEIVAKVEDASHPATRDLPAAWTVTDEIYQFRNFSRDRVRVLLSMDPASADVSKGKRADKDYALAWCREYGKGRMFYTALGHRKELWTDETFLMKHILPGIRWAAGDVAGDAAPRPKAE